MNKKRLLIVGISVFLLGLVIGAWFFEYDKSVTGEVVATGKKLHLIADLSNYTINTSTEIYRDTQYLTIDNKKDPRTVIFIINVDKILTEPMCPEFENDCNVEFRNATSQILNGTSYIIPKGILYFALNTTCVPYSCGQNITTHVEIKEP